MRKQRMKLNLSRETLRDLALGAASGGNTNTASAPCCPLTKTPGCDPTMVGCPTIPCVTLHGC
jgi:hypothetical protein